MPQKLDPELLNQKPKPPRFFNHWYAWPLLVFLGLILLVVIGWSIGFFGHALYRTLSTPMPTETVPVSVQPTEALAPTATPTIALVAPTPIVPTWTPVPTDTPIPTPTPTPALDFFDGPIQYGTSYGGRPLYAYRLGTGPSVRAIIGGIHGGYEWNTVYLVSDTLKLLQEKPGMIPANVTLYVIPCANPDGVAAGTDAIKGRMNGNLVDLNRNWDYEHQITATHGTRPVKAGTAPFSEPETAALRDLILGQNALGRKMEAVIFYHSAMGVIFSGADRENSATYELVEWLSAATGYRHKTDGIYGQITTGDAIDWLSTVGIAGAEIELLTHDRVSEQEWQQNLRGIEAFLDWSPPERFTLPPSLAENTWQGDYSIYIVEFGDTISQIALVHNVDEDWLMEINEITDPTLLQIGQELKIPTSDNQE